MIGMPTLRRVTSSAVLAAVISLSLSAAAQTLHRPAVRLWRLDCGQLDLGSFQSFSDTWHYKDEPHRLTDSCYLIRHDDTYLLWDTGIDGAFEGKVHREEKLTETLRERLVPQLARIGVTPAMIRYVLISHYHADHTGQAKDFPNATLLIGSKDWAAIKRREGEAMPVNGLQPWLTGRSKVDPIDGDRDLFGDGSVTMLSLPGHTPGHHALLIHLDSTGWVLLSGDQFHATESYRTDQVPRFNWDRAATLASTARFKEIVHELRPLVVIQHEPEEVGKLPTFPMFAD